MKPSVMEDAKQRAAAELLEAEAEYRAAQVAGCPATYRAAEARLRLATLTVEALLETSRFASELLEQQLAPQRRQ